jgi:hypothetical protein
MTQIHCWNEYDSLKTVILGSVFDNDKIPETFSGHNQENFIKIVEHSNKELKNFQKILEQLGVNVLRPSQPKNYNGLELLHHEPLINMRDFHMAYGNLFFMTYGPYAERRFQHLWLEDIVNNLIIDGNLIINANEFNFDDGLSIDNNVLKNSHEFFELNGIFPKTFTQDKIKQILSLASKNSKEFLEKYRNANKMDWFLSHLLKYKNKNIFHTASILKFNRTCFISKFGGNDIGKIWMENWLKTLGITPIYVPTIGHIDGKYNILNNETLLAHTDASLINLYFKNIIMPPPESSHNIDFSKSSGEIFNPTLWYTKWREPFNKHIKSLNSLSVNPQTTLFSFYDKNFYDKLKNIGIDAIYVEWTNDEFWEGGLHCITCDIERHTE